MKFSELEKKLKQEIAEIFSIPPEQLTDFCVTAPPPHIKADISTAWPISAAKTLRQPPLKIAERIKDRISAGFSAETAPPGFLNINLTDESLVGSVSEMLAGADYFRRQAPSQERTNVEFVSANPTGPLHLASGRAAALGDSLVRIMRFLGYHADAEFYINDAGRQVELLGRSLKARYNGEEPPEDGYKGEYLKTISAEIPAGAGWTDAEFSDFALKKIIELQKQDMRGFGVEFDKWFFESELHRDGSVGRALESLKACGMTIEKDGAIWFGASSAMHLDDKDRVLVKSNGESTYFLRDIAYHLNKYGRGFTKLVDILGADHHGFVPRMKAAVCALGKDPGSFKAIIHQMVLLKRGTTVLKMSKRAGEFIPLKELIDEAGVDACRFFFAMRAPDTHMNFDIDLAKKQSHENPVYYVQYVHARICSIFGNAAAKGLEANGAFDVRKTGIGPEERAILLKLLWFEHTLEKCVNDFSPHHLATYLSELAALFHSFYDKNKVLDENLPETTAFRLFLLKGVGFVTAAGLGLLGISAPEKM